MRRKVRAASVSFSPAPCYRASHVSRSHSDLLSQEGGTVSVFVSVRRLPCQPRVFLTRQPCAGARGWYPEDQVRYGECLACVFWHVIFVQPRSQARVPFPLHAGIVLAGGWPSTPTRAEERRGGGVMVSVFSPICCHFLYLERGKCP